jgi:hypothetical protein
MSNPYKELRNLGLKCNCTDCDAFGCDNCTVCRMDEVTAKDLLTKIEILEFEFGVKIQTILNNGNSYRKVY